MALLGTVDKVLINCAKTVGLKLFICYAPVTSRPQTHTGMKCLSLSAVLRAVGELGGLSAWGPHDVSPPTYQPLAISLVNTLRSDRHCLTILSYEQTNSLCYSGLLKETDLFEGPIPVALPRTTQQRSRQWRQGRGWQGSWVAAQTAPLHTGLCLRGDWHVLDVDTPCVLAGHSCMCFVCFLICSPFLFFFFF